MVSGSVNSSTMLITFLKYGTVSKNYLRDSSSLIKEAMTLKVYLKLSMILIVLFLVAQSSYFTWSMWLKSVMSLSFLISWPSLSLFLPSFPPSRSEYSLWQSRMSQTTSIPSELFSISTLASLTVSGSKIIKSIEDASSYCLKSQALALNSLSFVFSFWITVGIASEVCWNLMNSYVTFDFGLA